MSNIKETLDIIQEKLEDIYFDQEIKADYALKNCLWQIKYLADEAKEILKERAKEAK